MNEGNINAIPNVLLGKNPKTGKSLVIESVLGESRIPKTCLKEGPKVGLHIELAATDNE